MSLGSEADDERRGAAMTVRNIGQQVTVTSGPLAETTWTITREIGRGGTAVVYEVVSSDRRTAVLKVASDHRFALDESMRQRFLREAAHLLAVQHEHVVRGLGVGTFADKPALLMERAKASLYSVLRALPKRGLWVCVQWIRGALRGAAHLHSLGLAHRDLSPKNLLFMQDGRLVVADFGTVRHAEDTALTVAGEGMGSLIYTSRQQFMNAHAAKPSDDVFSLGQIAWEILAGYQPIGNVRPIGVVRPDVPKQLADLVEAMRADDPAARPATAGDALALFDRAVAEAQADDRARVESSLRARWQQDQLHQLGKIRPQHMRIADLLQSIVEQLGPLRLGFEAVSELNSDELTQLSSVGVHTEPLRRDLARLLGAGSARFFEALVQGGGFTWNVTFLHNRLNGAQVVVETFDRPNELHGLAELLSLPPESLSAFRSEAFVRGPPCTDCGERLHLRVVASDGLRPTDWTVSRSAVCPSEGEARDPWRCCCCGAQFRRVDNFDEHGRYDGVGCDCRGYPYDVMFDLSPWRAGRAMHHRDVTLLETYASPRDEDVSEVPV